MALALIGNIASKLLPSAISWGVNKLNHTNIGKETSKNLNKMFNKVIHLSNQEPVKKVIQAVSEEARKRMPKKHKMIKKYAKVYREPLSEVEELEESLPEKNIEFDEETGEYKLV